MKTIIVIISLFVAVQLQAQVEELYLDDCQSVNVRVEDLIKRMTIEEKISQLQDRAPAIPRLNIPEYNWWNESLHGVARAGAATSFPQAIGIAATWNPDLVHEMADAISTEARAKYNEAIRLNQRDRYQGLTMWSPNINIFRDPRWGRGQETYGEDPYLTSQIGLSFVKGLQGDDPNYLKVVATPKHFAVHSGPEPLRHEFDAYTNKQDLWETYLPAFEVCVKEGKAESVMSAYNRYLGESATASKLLLTEILREKWGFEGYVVSDCGAVSDIYARHKIASSHTEGASMALIAGCDLNCGDKYQYLVDAYHTGMVSEKDIDIALKRLFKARFKLGLFDSLDKVPYNLISSDVIESNKHQELALKVAQESLVLLKNDGTLPLSASLKKIAVTGPHANDRQFMMSNYFGTPTYTTTVLDEIKKLVSEETEVVYLRGCGLIPETISYDKIEAQFYTQKVKATYFDNYNWEGEPTVITEKSYIDFDWSGARAEVVLPKKYWSVVYETEMTAEETGDYLIKLDLSGGHGQVFVNNQCVFDSKTNKREFVLLEKTQKFNVKVKYQCHHTEVTHCQLQWDTPEMDQRSLVKEEFADADVIVYVGGISPRLEGEALPIKVDGFLGGDKTSLNLPSVQLQYLKELKKLGKPIVFVLTSGSALSINWCDQNINAILQAWYPGQAGGTAIAQTLFGENNPNGKLPITFYKDIKDLPPFEDYHMNNRTYKYFTGEALYPFGYGLSYSTFELSEPKLNKRSYNQNEDIKVRVTIKNNSNVDGIETVQLYTKDVEASCPVPLKSLKAFEKVSLKANESKDVTFTLTKDDLQLVNLEGEKVFESGLFEMFVGTNSSCINKATFEVK